MGVTRVWQRNILTTPISIGACMPLFTLDPKVYNYREKVKNILFVLYKVYKG